MVAISLAVERLLHYLSQVLNNKNQKPLYEALQKIKEELMLLGFISLLLTVSQNTISKFCVPASLVDNLLPCKRPHEEATNSSSSTSHHISGSFRRLLEETSSAYLGYCAQKSLKKKKNFTGLFGDAYGTMILLPKELELENKPTPSFNLRFPLPDFSRAFKDQKIW